MMATSVENTLKSQGLFVWLILKVQGDLLHITLLSFLSMKRMDKLEKLKGGLDYKSF